MVLTVAVTLHYSTLQFSVLQFKEYNPGSKLKINRPIEDSGLNQASTIILTKLHSTKPDQQNIATKNKEHNHTNKPTPAPWHNFVPTEQSLIQFSF